MSIVQQHTRRRALPRTPEDIRREIDLTLEARIARQDLYLTMHAEIEDGADDDVLANSQDVLALLIARDEEELKQKLRLYQRFRDHPYAATVPDRSSARYQGLLNTANDLRDIWPAERFATDILGVDLHKRGKTFVGRCPFHLDRTPSFTVYPDSDTYWCFGCFQKGDGIDIFAMLGRWHNIAGFRQQVEWLADFTHAWMGDGR